MVKTERNDRKEKIMIFAMENPQNAEELFKDWQETMIWSCLQGIMGKIYADDLSIPTTAMAVLGDFTFFAGEPVLIR